jgi:flavin-dependent dehydrogenase
MTHDLAIVGAGSAGAALAAHTARAGMKVVLLDRRSLDDAGARWVNGVARWMFDEAGVARPGPGERVGHEQAMHLAAGRDAAARVVIRHHDVENVDMRQLVARLQRDATEAGAELRGGVHVHGLEGDALRTSAGEIRAKTFVDASGLAGPRLLDQPRVAATDVCAAAHEMRRVRDVAGARAWFQRHEVRPGDALCFTGIAGGYSVLNVRVDDDLVSILTGSLPALGFPSGARILADFAAEQPWVGETVFGGSRSIPLRRPYDVLASDRVALLGDAACQVFTAHGSGVGIGLVAAKMLADALVQGRGPRDYAVAFHRRWGGLLTAYDVFRRFSQTMSAGDIARLMRAGLLDEEGARAGMSQRLPELTRTMLMGRVRGAVRAPAMARRFLGVLARMGVTQVLSAQYPSSRPARRVWSRAVSRVTGDGLSA